MGVFTAKIEITPETKIQRKSNLLFNQIDGEVVMLSIENSEYYGMDKVGSRIWELLEEPLSLKELSDHLLKEFEVSDKQCIEDTTKFLIKLIDKKLVFIA